MKWEARIQAAKEEERRGKVGDVHALADGKAVGEAKAGVRSRATIPKRVKPGQVPLPPEMRQIIDDEVENRVQQRLMQGEPKAEVRRQLNFQDEDDDYKEAETSTIKDWR